MRLKQNRALYGLIYGLLLTTFVTACVKSNGPDRPKEIPLKTLRSETLTQSQIEGDNSITLNDIGESAAAVEVTQIFTFTTDEIIDLKIANGVTEQDGCRDKSAFIVRYQLIFPDSSKKPIFADRDPELLVPGSYGLQVTVHNTPLCKEVTVNLKLKTTKRTDLVMTQNLSQSQTCTNVRNFGKNMPDSEVVVETNPMRVSFSQELEGGDDRNITIVDKDILCNVAIGTKTDCRESALPAAKGVGQNRPYMSGQTSCHNEAQRYRKGYADVQIFGRGIHGKNARVVCRNGGTSFSYTLENCRTNYNIGEKLPIQPGSTDVVIRRDMVRLVFLPNHKLMRELHLPNDEIYATFVKRINDRFVQRISQSQPINLDRLENGNVEVFEDRIRRSILNHDIKNVSIVFSRTPNLKRGIYRIDMNEICRDKGNSVNAIVVGGNELQLCEEN